MFAVDVPFVSPLSIGNDYLIFSPGAEIDMMWSCGKGPSLSTCPATPAVTRPGRWAMGQLYHPVPWLSSLMPATGAGTRCSGTRSFDCSRSAPRTSACSGSAAASASTRCPPSCSRSRLVYNLRMLDSFRYGASIDSYIGMLFVAAAGGFVYLDHRSKAPVALLASAPT